MLKAPVSTPWCLILLENDGPETLPKQPWRCEPHGRLQLQNRPPSLCLSLQVIRSSRCSRDQPRHQRVHTLQPVLPDWARFPAQSGNTVCGCTPPLLLLLLLCLLRPRCWRAERPVHYHHRLNGSMMYHGACWAYWSLKKTKNRNNKPN